MGLDMYLRASLSASDCFSADLYPGLRAAAATAGLPLFTEVPMITLTTSVAYWRKANQVHAWFVAEVQDGEDDCGRYPVSLDQLRDLCAGLVSRRDPDEAARAMPPRSGFFFGGTAIDERYWDDLAITFGQLDQLLATPGIERLDLSYQSSW